MMIKEGYGQIEKKEIITEDTLQNLIAEVIKAMINEEMVKKLEKL